MVDLTQAKKEALSCVANAKAILNGKPTDPEAILELVQQLHAQNEFAWARKILDQSLRQGAANRQDQVLFTQKFALSTYKDPHLNRKKALDQAIEILQDLNLKNTQDQETLGLAGAIYKRKWETDGIKTHLEQSLIYYQRGLEQGVKGDDGYTAINVAYIEDLLAYLEQKQARTLGASSNKAAERRKEANNTRKKIIASLGEHLKGIKLEKNHYWAVATLAEAYFATAQYAEAKTWLNKAKKIADIPEWERVSTAKQLVYLEKFQQDDLSDDAWEKTQGWQVLNEFLGKKAHALRSMYLGKVGLALSGGGFRASFYHIGVLAKLAELDLLRHIEVLSCVSGGSILGTHYYLELRRMFNVEKKKDEAVNREDYVQLVNNLVDDFLAGVQDNPRVKVLATPKDNLKMIFSSRYSRTQRLGELYEELIYSRIKDGEGSQKRWLNGLYINPIDTDNFQPKRDNWSRLCKIPELIINATTLNTGHNWQFTASWMGESATQIDADVDTNDRYRRTYYTDASEPLNEIRLGSAVGASACVPGLFEPIILQGLYKDTTVRLIDGGVYDNQGVSGLIEQDCTIIISSDATGQFNTQKDPGGGVLKPLLRTNSTLIQRVRNSQYQDLKARETAGILKGFAYAHLKQGLEGENVDWIGCDEPAQAAANPDAKTDYGIRKDIQALLAGIRTDLDSFSDIEAYALMTSGYYAIEKSIQQPLKDFPQHPGDRPEWKFLQVEAAMRQDEAGGEAYDRMVTQLDASSMTFAKVWKLDKTLNTLIKGAGVLILLCLAYIWYSNPGWQPFSAILTSLGNTLTLGRIMWAIVILLISSLATTVLGNLQAKAVKQALNFRDIPRRILVGASVGLVGWIGAYFHLRFFDKMFQASGKVNPRGSTEGDG